MAFPSTTNVLLDVTPNNLINLFFHQSWHEYEIHTRLIYKRQGHFKMFTRQNLGPLKNRDLLYISGGEAFPPWSPTTASNKIFRRTNGSIMCSCLRGSNFPHDGSIGRIHVFLHEWLICMVNWWVNTLIPRILVGSGLEASSDSEMWNQKKPDQKMQWSHHPRFWFNTPRSLSDRDPIGKDHLPTTIFQGLC